MPNFLPRVERQPSTAERFGNAFSSAAQTAATEIPEFLLKNQQDKAEVEGIKRLTGLDLSGIKDPNVRSQFIAESLKGNQSQMAQLEKMKPFIAGLQTIQEMRQIGSKNNLGRGSSTLGFFGGETAKDRAQYQQLGKSLISLASTIPIRNKAEFETLAADLYDPSLPDEAREGILSAMENIIKRSAGFDDGMEQEQPQMKQNTASRPQGPGSQKKRPLSSFHG